MLDLGEAGASNSTVEAKFRVDLLICTTRDADSLGFLETTAGQAQGALGIGAPKLKAWPPRQTWPEQGLPLLS